MGPGDLPLRGGDTQPEIFIAGAGAAELEQGRQCLGLLSHLLSQIGERGVQVGVLVQQPTKPGVDVVGSTVACVRLLVAGVGPQVPFGGPEVACVGSAAVFVEARLALVGDEVAVIGNGPALVGDAVTGIRLGLAAIRLPVAFVGAAVTLVGCRRPRRRDAVAFVGRDFALIRGPIARIGRDVPLVGDAVAIRRRQLLLRLRHDHIIAPRQGY